MKTTKCTHPNAIEDGYFECFHCEDCGEYVKGRDVHFDVSGTFHDEEDSRVYLKVTEEEYVDKTWLGLQIHQHNFVDGDEDCYINLSEDQVLDLHNLLSKHIHNMNMKAIEEHKTEYEELFTQEDE